MSESEVSSLFVDQFGHEPDVVAFAPGRVNLIGEHTDYNDGFVFPAAIDRVTWVAAKLTDHSSSRAVSLQIGPGQEFSSLHAEPGKMQSWTKYLAGMAWAFREAGFSVPDADFAVMSTIPMGSGVSSSAALEMAVGRAWLHLIGQEMSGANLARLGQRCENGFVGVQSGIMDQMASACGRQDHAMFLDTRSLEIRYAPIPQDWKIVLLDTGKARSLTKSAYNERRGACERVAAYFGQRALRDISLAELESAQNQLGADYNRAKHGVTEDQRTLAFAAALDAGDPTTIGHLMRESHESLRDDYEVSCDELDAMAEAAWSHPGCVGARLTGAGFGGACVALVLAEAAEDFCDAVVKQYQAAIGDERGLSASALVTQAWDGARVTHSGDIN